MSFATAVFLLSTLFVVYVLFGYPVALAIASQRRRSSFQGGFEPKSVSVLVAVRNGAGWLERKLDSILALNYPKDQIQILIISDGSTDRTNEIAQEYAARGVRLLTTPPGGKALALNHGMREASGEILLFTDVRQTLDGDSLRHLVACFADPAVGVASGELVILDDTGREDSRVGLYWKYEKWIRRKLSSIDSIFGATGSIYAVRRELAVELPEDCLLDDVHLPMAAFFRGYRLIVEEKARAYDVSNSLETEFLRKVRTLAGVYQVIRAYPALMTPRNRLLFHFLSYKFGRMMLPFALLAIAVATIGLPDPWRLIAAAGQAVVYGMAWFHPRLPKAVQQLSSPARTFCVLMAATFCAASIFFVPARDLWRKPSS